MLLTILWFGVETHAQEQITGQGPAGVVPIYSSDLAILDAQEHRKDLPCEVHKIDASLGFDLALHAGYDVRVPLHELAGNGGLLAILVRVSAENREDEPAYFGQRFKVPPIEPDATGDARLQGMFALGEGKYHTDWLMRDSAGRVCSSHWDYVAAFEGKSGQAGLLIPPGVVRAQKSDIFQPESPVLRHHENGAIYAKLMLNFATRDNERAALQPADIQMLLSLLRTITREAHIGRLSVVAFNLDEQRVVYRQQTTTQIDFPALKRSLKSLKLGTVDVKGLKEKDGPTDFLTNLLVQEMGQADKPDVLIFAGPKDALGEQLSPGLLKKIGPVSCPVFYVNYNSDPGGTPWRDLIGKAVRLFKGREYTVTTPHDLWRAYNEMMSKLLNTKNGHPNTASSTT